MKHHFTSAIIISMTFSVIVSCSKEETVYPTSTGGGPGGTSGPVMLKELTINVNDLTRLEGLTFHRVYENLITDVNPSQNRLEIYAGNQLMVPNQEIIFEKGAYWITTTNSDLTFYFTANLSGPPPVFAIRLVVYEN